MVWAITEATLLEQESHGAGRLLWAAPTALHQIALSLYSSQ